MFRLLFSFIGWFVARLFGRRNGSGPPGRFVANPNDGGPWGPGPRYGPGPVPGYGQPPAPGYSQPPVPGYGQPPGQGYGQPPAAGYGQVPGPGTVRRLATARVRG